jgi:hypothetical protein
LVYAALFAFFVQQFTFFGTERVRAFFQDAGMTVY